MWQHRQLNQPIHCFFRLQNDFFWRQKYFRGKSSCLLSLFQWIFDVFARQCLLEGSNCLAFQHSIADACCFGIQAPNSMKKAPSTWARRCTVSSPGVIFRNGAKQGANNIYWRCWAPSAKGHLQKWLKSANRKAPQTISENFWAPRIWVRRPMDSSQDSVPI